MTSDVVAESKRVYSEYYERNYDRLNGMRDLLLRIGPVVGKGIGVEHTSCRIKDLEKCLDKIDRKYRPQIEAGSDCRQLITDLIGFRFVCRYADEVDQIRQRLLHFFSFTDSDVTDKIKELEEMKEVFGYRAVHVDAKLNNDRTRLEEYSEFADIRVEFQIRTLAQDTWAAIERTIGYNQELPKLTRRRFTLLAALLELADKEFLEIRDQIAGQSGR